MLATVSAIAYMPTSCDWSSVGGDRRTMVARRDRQRSEKIDDDINRRQSCDYVVAITDQLPTESYGQLLRSTTGRLTGRRPFVTC